MTLLYSYRNPEHDIDSKINANCAVDVDVYPSGIVHVGYHKPNANRTDQYFIDILSNYFESL